MGKRERKVAEKRKMTGSGGEKRKVVLGKIERKVVLVKRKMTGSGGEKRKVGWGK